MPRIEESHYAHERNYCSKHSDDFWGVICPKCHSENTVRIEKESAELRATRTPEFMQRQRQAGLARLNGH